MNRAFIFDFDGVIIDSEHLKYQTYKRLFKEEYSIILPDKDDTIIGRTSKKNINYFLKKYNLQGNLEELIHKRNILLTKTFSKGENIKTLPGFFNFLENLKSSDYKLAIASSANKDYINKTLDYLNLTNVFDIIVSGEMVNKSKPNPEIFIQTAKKLNKRNEDCIVIEDSINGLIAAKSAGMKVIAVSSSFSKKKLRLADLIIENFEKPKYLIWKISNQLF